MTTTPQPPNVHALVQEADRQADFTRAKVLGDELTRLQARINELESENARLRGTSTTAQKK